MATDGDLAAPVNQPTLTKRKLLGIRLDYAGQMVTIEWAICTDDESIIVPRPPITLQNTEAKSYLDALTASTTGPSTARVRTRDWLIANKPEEVNS